MLAKAPLVYGAGPWEIDLVRRELRAHGVPVVIGGRAFDLVEKLVQSAGELVTKDELRAHAWPSLNVEENTLQVHIAAIRRAFGADRGMLKTASRRGYRLTGEWRVRNSDASMLSSNQGGQKVGVDPPTNLPARVTNLIGRFDASKFLRDLLSAYRIVTLTGPGGIGKTVLAIEAARSSATDFPDGVWLVELAASNDAGLTASTIAATLKLQLSGETISPESISRALGKRTLLLVLDNCEHVIDAAANVAEAIIRHCPNVTVLTTSREVLRIPGECVYRVPPLDVPSSNNEGSEQLLERSAVELFVIRTQAIDASFSPRREILPSIAAICRHLDGIPLAIEFAAARAATLGAQQVAAGLSDRFDLLASRRRTALPRHQTLRAALDWSYALLSSQEQKMLRQLAIFSGGFSVEAVVAVAPGIARNVADEIGELVTKSLVVFDGMSSPNRWRLLETIRAFALQKLAEAGELTSAAKRHAEHFRDMIVPIATNSMGRLSGENVARLSRELDNVRAAIDWSFSNEGETATGAALTAAFASIWLRMYLVGECRERVERMMQVLGPGLRLEPALEWQMLIAYSTTLITTLARVDRARAVVARAEQLAEGIDNIVARMHQLWAQWSVEMVSGDYRSALATVRRLTEIAHQSGDKAMKLRADRYLASSLLDAGRLDEARSCLDRLIEHYAVPHDSHRLRLFQHDQHLIARARRSRVLYLQGHVDRAVDEARISFEETNVADARSTLWWVLQDGLCPIALMTGDLTAADRAISAMMDWAVRLDAELWKALAPSWKGRLQIARGEFEDGVALLRRSLDLCEQTGWQICRAQSLGSLAQGLAGLGRLGEALKTIEQAIVRADKFGEEWYRPELIRVKGELLLAGSVSGAEECLSEALALAREQGALSWELRIALSMARLELTRNHYTEARQILAPVYGRFTEGFTTADLRAAREILDGLPQ